jgi:hypothetical protein
MDGNVASQEQMEAHSDDVIEMASYDPFGTLVQQRVGKRGKHIEATSIFWGIKPNGRDCKTCS